MNERKTLHEFEKNIKMVLKKALLCKESEMTDQEKYTLFIIEKTKEYFRIYDKTENKELYTVFTKLFLNTARRERTIVSLSIDFNIDPRSLLRQKKKILKIYSCIYEEFRK